MTEPVYEDEQVEPVVLDEWLVTDLDRLEALKGEIGALEAEKEILEASIAKEMLARQIKDAQYLDHNGRHVKATVVAGQRRTLDLVTLAKSDPKLARIVSKNVVDTHQLEKAVGMGLFAGLDYLFTVKPNRPYVKFTPVDAAQPEGTPDE